MAATLICGKNSSGSKISENSLMKLCFCCTPSAGHLNKHERASRAAAPSQWQRADSKQTACRKDFEAAAANNKINVAIRIS